MTLHLRRIYLGERFFSVAGVAFDELAYQPTDLKLSWLGLRASGGESSGTVLVTGCIERWGLTDSIR